jgi:hypothetical protein
VTNKITASALWIPEAWRVFGLTEDAIETAVAHAVCDGKDTFRLVDKNGGFQWFDLKDESLEFQFFKHCHWSEPHRGVVEINVFTLTTMTRHYVSIILAG